MNLQETIKKVLREESEKRKSFKDDVKNYINNNGFEETKNMLGMDTLDLVKLLDLNISSKMANDIILESIENKKLTTKYKGYLIFVSSMEGLVYWATRIKTGHYPDNLHERIDFVATPFWDGETHTPIELDFYSINKIDGTSVFKTYSEGTMYYKELKGQSEFGSVEELFTWYNEFYLPGVYSNITDIVNKVHRHADWELSKK